MFYNTFKVFYMFRVAQKNVLFEERFARPRTQGPPWEAPGAPRGRNGPPFLNFWSANAETSLVPSTFGRPDAQTSAPAARKSYAKSGFGPSTCSIPQGNKHIPLLRNVFSKDMILRVPGPCSPPRPRQNTFFGETCAPLQKPKPRTGSSLANLELPFWVGRCGASQGTHSFLRIMKRNDLS